MASKLFTGFSQFIEEEEEDYRFSNRANTLAKKLNMDGGDIAKMGWLPVVPSIIKFQAGELPPWDKGEGDDGVIKWYEIIELGENFARVREMTGGCDRKGMNRDNVMAQCSPTSGKVFTITGKQLDWLTTHIAGQSQGGMGGMGGLGGGLGGGMPPPAPMGGAAPPPPTGGI